MTFPLPRVRPHPRQDGFAALVRHPAVCMTTSSVAPADELRGVPTRLTHERPIRCGRRQIRKTYRIAQSVVFWH